MLTASVLNARAQSSADSVAIWTSQLERGTDASRAEALAQLSELPAAGLPAGTQRAVIAELRRLHAGMLASPPVPWKDDSTGEYYMALVGVSASLGTKEAYRALIPSIGVSLGIGMRVARLGDEAVPALRDLIRRGYEHDVALGTLGLVSFWADSTDAPLSPESRSQILQAFLQAYGASSHRMHLGLLMGLENANDPTLLPLARALQSQSRATDDIFIAKLLDPVILSLEARNRQLSLADLLRRVQRNVQSICERAAPSKRRGICQAVQNEMTESIRHIEHGDTQPARSGLASALKAAERARGGGYITPAEYAMITGGIQEIVSRL